MNLEYSLFGLLKSSPRDAEEIQRTSKCVRQEFTNGTRYFEQHGRRQQTLLFQENTGQWYRGRDAFECPGGFVHTRGFSPTLVAVEEWVMTPAQVDDAGRL